VSRAATLPPIDHVAHREALRARLGGCGLTAVLVTGPANVRYLSGFAGSSGQLLLGPEAAGDRLITDHRYLERAATETHGLEIVLSRDPFSVALDQLRAREPAGDGPARRSRGGPVLGFEADHLSWHQGERLRELAAAEHLEVRPTSGLTTEVRSVKDADELARLEQACAVTVEALAWLLDEVVARGRTERDLAVALERRFVDLRADGVAFPSIVAGGPHSAIPHHAPTDRPLERGDLLTVDCGALVDGYHADCTRTVAVGPPGDELVALHDLVARAQTAGRDAAVVGATAGDVDAAARTLIEAAGFGARFVHGTGHGVGLEIHEAPSVARGARARLVAGMALTVEPGVYLPGVGGVRIEDTIVVTANAPARILTDLPRELRVL
jgi:Xaa-Pro aminopeptidase